MKFGCVGALSMSLLITQLAGAQTPATPTVAASPPMGWNSWDAYGLTITEDQFRANVKVLVTQLKPFGYNYAVIDEGWFFRNPQDRPHPEKLIYALDANGRYVPVPARFPSAGSAASSQPKQELNPKHEARPPLLYSIESTSFKPLGDWVHSQGLKFGIHIVRGIPRASVENNLPIANSTFHAQDAADTSDACPWDPTNWGLKDTPAGQAWYDSLLAQYAGWGVDLLKVDCIADHPYKADEIRMIRRAIDKATAKTGRPIVLSLSPGPTNLEHAEEVGQLANMWRISDDIWDLWANPKPWPRTLSSQFATTAAWAPSTKPGNWPDADMLPLGELRPVPGDGQPRTTRLTPTEQKTMLTLWSMARSPLIVGANLTLLDDATLKLLTNRDVLAIDQTATRSGEVLHSGDIIAWTADLPATPEGYTQALAIFNVGEGVVTITTSFEAYGLDDATYHVKDAWTGKTLRLKSIENLSLEPHASTLLLLKK